MALDMVDQNTNNEKDLGSQNETVQIKKEKIDPEIENKIKELGSTIKQEKDDKLNQNGEDDASEDDEEDSDTQSSQAAEEDHEEEEDEKKNVEPVKSSNEILAELFKVFNAAPPEELLDDKNLIEKSKKRKKEKKKKHKKDKSNNGENADSEAVEGSGTAAGSSSKHKKKKKHKHKHKDGEKSKEKKKSKDSEKERTEKSKSKDDKNKEKPREKKKSKERDKSADKDKPAIVASNVKKESSTDKKHESSHGSSSYKRNSERDTKETADTSKRRKIDEKDVKHNAFYGGVREKDQHKEHGSSSRDKHHASASSEIKIKKESDKSRSRKISDGGDISDISLSDEDIYLERKNKETDGKYRGHNSFYAGSKRSRSRENDRSYNSRDHYRGGGRDADRDRNRDNFHHRSARGYHSRRSRSRTRSRSRDLGIDKKRLLEIARKNAISMFKRGNLPGCDNMTEDVKDRVLLKMRYGGRTVEDLTEFCKKISNGEHLSDLSSDEGSDVDKAGNAKAFHHPFQLKEREPIVMHIRNSKPILPVAKTDEQTKTITMQFPVSSGQQHRMTEAWVPVENKDKLPPLPSLPAATQSTSIFKNVTPKNALGKPLPVEGEQEPAFKPVEDASTATTNVNANNSAPVQMVPPPVTVPPPPISNPFATPPPVASTGVPPPAIPIGVPPPPIASNNFIPDVPVPSSRNSVFPEMSAHQMDVSSIISKRLNAMRRLQDNPMDSEAIKMMYNSQKEMTSWAASKHLPGQFTGSTGVNVLKPNQLNSGPQVWARRDQLTSSKPVTGGMGMHLLQKMGWRPGEGLGREKNGSLQPLLLDVKLDKRGLVAQEDIRPPQNKAKRSGQGGGPPQMQNIQDKHPVCLLNELTTKYKWTPPMYKLENENGPSHSRMFLFSVHVNNQSYTPAKSCNTKKEAKVQAAKLCLQQLGFLQQS